MKKPLFITFFLLGLIMMFFTSCSKKSRDSTPAASLTVTVNNITYSLTDFKIKVDVFSPNDNGYWLKAHDQSDSINLFLETGPSISPGTYNAVAPYGSDAYFDNEIYVDFPPRQNSTVIISYINNGLMTGSFSGNFNDSSNVYGFFKNFPTQ